MKREQGILIGTVIAAIIMMFYVVFSHLVMQFLKKR